MSIVSRLKRVTIVLSGGFSVSHRYNVRQSSYRPLWEGRSYVYGWL